MIPSLRKHCNFSNLTQYMVNHPNMISRGRSRGGKEGKGEGEEEVNKGVDNGEEKE